VDGVARGERVEQTVRQELLDDADLEALILVEDLRACRQ